MRCAVSGSEHLQQRGQARFLGCEQSQRLPAPSSAFRTAISSHALQRLRIDSDVHFVTRALHQQLLESRPVLP
jgi:hypothetical protein